MPTRLRIRWREGLDKVEAGDDWTLAQLLAVIKEKTGYEEFTVKEGWPPKEIDIDGADQTTVSSLGWNGNTLNVQANAILSDDTAAKSALPQTPAVGPAARSPAEYGGENSLAGAAKVAKDDEGPPTMPEKAAGMAVDWPERGGSLILRVMADDNSCLFTAVGGALKIPDPAARLRKEVTDYIREHPAEYTKAILENQEPEKYIQRILNLENWGGYIELDIISRIYQIQIAVVVVEHMNVMLVGEGMDSRVMIMWSGPHYDRVVFVPDYLGSNADTDFDETRWSPGDDQVLEKAKELAAKLKSIHYFTNLTQSLWSCSSCDWMGEGEKGMTAHMKDKGHTGFQEIEVT